MLVTITKAGLNKPFALGRNHNYHMNKKPSTEMLGHGYNPAHYHGSMKQPIFQTSTYEFPSAQAGKDYFAWVTGKEELPEGATIGNIYSRLGSPNTQLLEQRLALLDQCDQAVVFASGMAAISAALFEVAKPGTVLLHTNPVYGGTHSFIHHYLAQYNVHSYAIDRNMDTNEVIADVHSKHPNVPICGFFTETPANPSMDLYSILDARTIADAFTSEERPVPVIVDNTYMGPLMSAQHGNGADIVLYSATKNLGGHSDVIAGAATGNSYWMGRLRMARTFMGGILGPMDSWLLLRSLETYELRTKAQEKNTHKVAKALSNHPAVEAVKYLGNIEQWGPKMLETFTSEYTGTGSMIALYINGGEKECFNVLDHLQVFKLGVSLGSTESLAEHPHSMTHAKVDDELKPKIGISENLIRLSIGVEDYEDLIQDLNAALNRII
jgi:methionine-gamma-lyase